MKLKIKYALITAGLIVSVVASMAVMVVNIQRRALREQAGARLDAIMVGVTRLAQESIKGKDELMVLSYLDFLLNEHPELAAASVVYRGHTSRVGSEGPDLMVLTAAVGSPQAITVNLSFRKKILDADLDRELRPLIQKTLAAAVVFIALGMLGAAGIAQLLTRSIVSLTNAVVEVGHGNLDVSVDIRRSDEVGTLAQRFNAMIISLKEFTQFREDILHTLTHELNTPLSGLKGYLELWFSRELPEDDAERQDILQTMIAAVLRMENSLGNALQLFRASSGQEAFEPLKTVWVESIFNDVCTLFMPVARSKKIILHPLPPDAAGFLHAEEVPLRQIVTNLISNALKFTPDGGEIRLGLTDTPHELCFWVSDTGYGIPAQDIPHLFTKFYRAEAGRSGAKQIPGTGLGLHITKKAVDMLGGQIRVESVVGKGSTFLVSVTKSPPPEKDEA